MTDPKERMADLVAKLNQAAREYYELDQPVMTDNEYDSLMRELETLESAYPALVRPDSPTHRVGDALAPTLAQVTHEVPMLSLLDVFSADELRAFDARIRASGFTPEYVCELKIDGIASNAHYEKGLLTLGSTRGNGHVGEVITSGMMTVATLPKRLSLPLTLDVRGEIYMRKSTFARLNEARAEQGLELFMNPRNAAGGSLRQLDPEITRSRELSTFSYTLVHPLDHGVPTQSAALACLSRLGFTVNPEMRLCHSIEEVIAYTKEWEKKKDDLDYPVDGIVVKTNDFAMQEEIGYTVKTPKHSIAYKFPALEVETVLKDIVLTVGRTGAITPNAVLEPVMIAGSLVAKATLNNEDFIVKKDIRKGDAVFVRKAGEIIPEVVRVDLSRRAPSLVPFRMSATCPACGGALVRLPGEADHYCLNKSCPGRVRATLVYYASKPCLDMDGFGETVVATLHDAGLLPDIPSFYGLAQKRERMLALPGFGEKSVDGLLAAVEASRALPLHRYVTALGIPLVGAKGARALCTRFTSFAELMAATTDDILSLSGFGSATATSLVTFFKEERPTILALIAHGIDPQGEKKALTSALLAGQSIVCTGKLMHYTRESIEEAIRALGGSPASAVSRKTSFVIAGTDAGSKLTRAHELGIKVLTEEEFQRMIEEPRQA